MTAALKEGERLPRGEFSSANSGFVSQDCAKTFTGLQDKSNTFWLAHSSGERRLLACCRRQLADDAPSVATACGMERSKSFSASCRKEQAGSLCSPAPPGSVVSKSRISASAKARGIKQIERNAMRLLQVMVAKPFSGPVYLLRAVRSSSGFATPALRDAQ